MPSAEVRQPVRPASYGFRYTDQQRQAVVELLALAMKVVRGEGSFDVMQQRYPIWWKNQVIQNSRRPEGTFYGLDAEFLNRWSGIDIVGNPNKRDPSIFEAEYFELDLIPGLPGLRLEDLETLLQLKVESGDGTNPDQTGGTVRRFNGPTSRPGFILDRRRYAYEPLNPPQGDIRIRIEFTFLDSDASGDRSPNTLKSVLIRREYLTPEEIKRRNDQKLGHLPQTGQLCQRDGQYIPFFADDRLTALARIANTRLTYGVGNYFSSATVRDPATSRELSLHAWWQWVAPDPLAEDLARLFGKKLG